MPSLEQKTDATDELRKRLGELEQRNRALENVIALAGQVLGNDALAIAGRANAWLAAVVDSSDDAIVSKNLDGIVTSWNRAAERIFGYTSEEMVGQSILKIIPEHLRSEEGYILGKIRAGERVSHYETIRRRKDGTFVNISVSVSPVRDPTGLIVGASKVARDISGQREGDRARGLLASIVATSDDAIISKDLNGIITSWNSAAEKLYGYTAAEMVGSPVLRIVPPELHEDEARILAKIRAGERIDHYETTRVDREGRRIEVSLTVSPIRASSGTIVGASKIARDLTAQREAQRQKDHFLAVLAHELRNPLAPIRNAIAIFGNPAMDAAQRARAQAIAERQFQHLARLLDDLLDVSRITNGRVELQRVDAELNALVRQAAEASRDKLDERGHAFDCDLVAEALPIHADPVRIVQAVANLLTNAAKYTNSGGHVRLATRREGGEAVVEVRDNGIGFPPAMAPRLFTLFAQEPGSVGRSEGGLGIGLALVREFIERHGGSVGAVSAGPGKGSTFTIRLPLA